MSLSCSRCACLSNRAADLLALGHILSAQRRPNALSNTLLLPTLLDRITRGENSPNCGLRSRHCLGNVAQGS